MLSYKTYNNYGAYLRERYHGNRVFKVIVDAGFTCPNRDGTKAYGGCAYCNVDAFTPMPARTFPSIREQIEKSMAIVRKVYQADKFIIYFQPNTNTYADVNQLKTLYDEALSYHTNDIVGLAIGTRADCINQEKLALLESYTDRFDLDLELGMESIYETTLLSLNRACTHADLVRVLNLLEKSKINICVHSIFGLPGETQEMMLKYADEINRFKQIKFIKLHHLYITEGSIMGAKYKRTPFKLFTLKEYTDFLCEFIPRLRPNIVIQRLFSVSDEELLIAPRWGLKKQTIQSHLEQEMIRRKIVQGEMFQE